MLLRWDPGGLREGGKGSHAALSESSAAPGVERGTPGAVKLILRLALALGRPSTRVLLLPITAYFFVTAPLQRKASRAFLERALGRKPSLLDLWRHFHCYATTLLDKVYMLADRPEVLEFRLHGTKGLDRALEQGPGCILLGSHLGSFEVLRVLALHHTDRPIKVVMETAQTPEIDRVLEDLSPRIKDSVIPLGSPGALLRVQESLQAGAMVGFLGDRMVSPNRALPVPFFGEPAHFPTGPLYIALRLKIPVILFFGIYRGGNRYDVHFEPFLAPTSISEEGEPDLPRELGRYVSRLETYARQYPYNWFNFYDFWSR